MGLSDARYALLDALWRDFVGVTPEAARVRALLESLGEPVHHDHVGLRTFAAPEVGLGIEALARPFEAAGFRPRERYRLDGSGLRARYWQHPDPDAPKLFIAELDPAQLPPPARAIVARLVAQIPAGLAGRPDLAWAGRPWALTAAEHQELLAASEHAARIAALGLRVDHVALDLGALIAFPDRAALAAFLAEHGFRMDLARRPPRLRPERIAVALADAIVHLPSGTYALTERDARWPPPRPREAGYMPVSVAK